MCAISISEKNDRFGQWTYQGKEEEGRPNLAGKMRAREMTEAGLKDDNATNRAACRNKFISYTSDPR